jgi:prepilin-type N-terminal cleavage/methylation domain-containing protein
MKEHGITASQDGFSLLEVLIALTILAVGLLALALFQVTAIQGNASANDIMVATYYGQDQMERFQLVPFDNLVSSPYGISGDPPVPDNAVRSITDNTQTTVSKKGQRYYRVWAVTNVTPTLKMIRLWVYWWDERGRPHNVQLVTQRGRVS